ncbi:unnamed protein product [Lactuca virosa]|uniref:Uncharacterized protein n=1 Tax=Lactuca virosa TaxID=75947 RepID=A0AAU9P7T3_9ASTR|nr:unnamed protein product [Lactuca virosa]
MKIRLICRSVRPVNCGNWGFLGTKHVVGDGLSTWPNLLILRFCSRLVWVKISLQSQFFPNPTVLNIFLKEDEDFKAMGMKGTSATF